MTDKDLEEIIAKMIKNEEDTVKHISETISKVQNNAVKLLMQIMLTDSLKHGQMLKIILNIMKTPIMEGREVAEVLDSLKKHVEEEMAMTKDFESLIDKIKDRRIKFLLENIVTDEKRHHSVMERIVKLIGDSETSDDEWWDFLYRYSRLT